MDLLRHRRADSRSPQKGKTGRKRRSKRASKMTGNLAQDWPVYVLLGVVVFFFGYVIIKSNMSEKKDKDTADKK